MDRQVLLESDISKFLEKNRIDKNNVIIRTPPIENLPTKIFCNICGNCLAEITWGELEWHWVQYPHKCL
jgi:hypothetical protein